MLLVIADKSVATSPGVRCVQAMTAIAPTGLCLWSSQTSDRGRRRPLGGLADLRLSEQDEVARSSP